jgi:hypothetical protein
MASGDIVIQKTEYVCYLVLVLRWTTRTAKMLNGLYLIYMRKTDGGHRPRRLQPHSNNYLQDRRDLSAEMVKARLGY